MYIYIVVLTTFKSFNYVDFKLSKLLKIDKNPMTKRLTLDLIFYLFFKFIIISFKIC